MPHPSIGKLIAIGILRKLPWDGHADAASRTTHEITLNERLAQLNAVIDPLKEKFRSNIAPSVSLFNNSAASDPSKLAGLRKVAAALVEQRSLPFTDAINMYHDGRSNFL